MASTDTSPAWPAHGYETRPWRQRQRGGTREDRMLREVTVALPPRVAERGLVLDGTLTADLESATLEITALDRDGEGLAALGVLLLRTESVASSRIELVEAGLDDYARALHGVRSNPSATSMVAATAALDELVGDVRPGGRITLEAVVAAHDRLMADDPVEGRYSGLLRPVQNWIGGSDHSPRDALFVPPPPELVGGYLRDLLAFANRDDLPALVQAALAHAQFESVHPFTDGNGRIGRALVNLVLRRRGTTTRVVVPLASSLVAHRERYFATLDAYRRGEVRPLLSSFAAAARIAAAESRRSAVRLAAIPGEWRDAVGPVRRGSAAAALLDALPAVPIVSSDDVEGLTGAPRSSVFAAIARLHEAGVLRPLTDRRRNQLWGAAAILDELDDLGRRIAAASA